ncbi:S-layer homology domain-containing protein [Desulfitibacter alkalitolerans]|uniref:S-layer homology domain-containing protein n=1 Tax=Desulfitibacter alkalitolerans TaxID=264641 RepID=UPI00146FBD3A|nr:S-layer homology domain-containing protein [Desulfitibacter alkalitolerans]
MSASGTKISIIGDSSGNTPVIYKNPSSMELFYINSKDGVVIAMENLILTGDNPETPETEVEGTGIRFYSYVSAGNNRIDIVDCIFENLNLGILQDYSRGIQVNISNSSITGNRPLSLTESYSQSIVIDSSYLKTLGIQTYDSVIYLSGYTGTTFTLTDSIIEGTGVGRGVYGSLVSANISDNQFTNLSIAIEIDDIRTALIENNYVETSEDGFDIETDYTSHSQIHVINNTLINLGEKNNSAVGLGLDIEDEITSGDFKVTNNTFVNFGLGIYYYGDTTDNTFDLILGGEGLGNTFRGNIYNINTVRLKTESKIDLRGTDWGTEDRDEVLLRLKQSSVLLPSGWAENVEDVYLLDDVLVTSAPEDVYVDHSYSADNSDGYVYGETAFNDIQTALAYVKSGGNVNIADGLYNRDIWLDRPVSLIGSGEDTIIAGNTTHDSVSVLVTGDNTSISRIHFLSGYHGIKYENSVLSKPRNFAVTDCIFTDIEAVSIYFYGWDHGSQNEGIVEIARNTLSRSEIYSGSTMIYVEGAFEEVYFKDNQISGYTGYSVSLNISGNLTVANNQITSSSAYHEHGLYLKSDKDLLITGNYIESLVSSTPYNSGIYLYFPPDAAAPFEGKYQKQVFNNRIKGYYYGLHLSGEENGDIFDLTIGGSDINRNNFSGNTYGIYTYLNLHELVDINATYNIWGVPFESMDTYIITYGGSNINYIPVASSEPVLNSLTISEGTLTPSFGSDVFSYTVNVANNIELVNINPVAYYGSVTVNGDAVPYGNTKNISLATGNNTVTIEVSDGSTSNIYTLNIIRASVQTQSSGSSLPSATVTVTVETKDKGKSIQTTINSRPYRGEISENITSNMFDALIRRAKRENFAGKNDSINILINSLGEASQIQIGFKKSDLSRILGETDCSFGVYSDLIEVAFDQKALAAINAEAEDEDIIIKAGRAEMEGMSESNKKKVEGRPVYSIQVKAGDKTVSHFKGGHAYVTVPYTLGTYENPNAVVVYYIGNDGNLKTVRGKYSEQTKSVTFKTPHFSLFAIGYNHKTFQDVSKDSWYYDAVTFISAREITSGTSPDHFSPNSPLTRGQFIVLLMNTYDLMNYEKDIVDVENFIDSGDTYYTEYLYKARKLGLTEGIGNNIYGPERKITRQEMLTTLYNSLLLIEELPEKVGEITIEDFKDTDSIAGWALESVASLIERGIVSGNNGYINPSASATRAEMAQMLYNLLKR